MHLLVFQGFVLQAMLLAIFDYHQFITSIKSITCVLTFVYLNVILCSFIYILIYFSLQYSHASSTCTYVCSTW